MKASKSIKALAAAVVMSAGTLFAQAPAPNINWYTNDSAADTFYIATADELAGLASLVNSTAADGLYDRFEGRTIILTRNVNLAAYGEAYNGGEGWAPIGRSLNFRFRGVFDGNGKVVSGLYINSNRYDLSDPPYDGLFGCVDTGGEVKNLGVVGVDITGYRQVGGIAGGVIVGKIANCYTTGTITGSNSEAGGIVGYVGNRCSVLDCYSAAAVSASRYGTVGGVAGSLGDGSIIKGCYSTGAVNAAGDYAGGVVGSVSGSGTASVSGKAGVVSCYSTGAVSGKNRVGGVVGSISFTGDSVKNCYSTGAVSGDAYVGGVAGYNSGRVLNCAALNPSVTKDAYSDYSGRVVGYSQSGSSGVLLSGNLAFDGIINEAGTAVWSNKGAANVNGADISAPAVNADGTVGRLFADADIWTAQNGKLPGLFGQTVDMPRHLTPPVNAQAPTITAHPADGEAAVGEAGSTHGLTVSARVTDGGELSYQWYSHTTESTFGGTEIPGATGAAYDAPADEIGIFYYYVVVTNTIADNGDGGAKSSVTTSAAATLTVKIGSSVSPPERGAPAARPFGIAHSGAGLRIVGAAQATPIRIYDMRGKLLMSRSAMPDELISLSRLARGTYVVKALGNSVRIVR